MGHEDNYCIVSCSSIGGCPLEEKSEQERIPSIIGSIVWCWVCVIFFARVVVSERLRRARRGVRGGRSPPRGGSGAAPPNFFFSGMTYFRDDIFPGPHDI
jgi:hypothetical protein